MKLKSNNGDLTRIWMESNIGIIFSCHRLVISNDKKYFQIHHICGFYLFFIDFPTATEI